MLRIAPQGPPPQPQGQPQGQPPPELLAALAQAQAQGGGPSAQGGPPQPPSDPTQDPNAPPSGGEPDQDDSDAQMMGHKIPAQLAGYMGPENGPFQCGNCKFFEAPNSCCVVDGNIDPNGCCDNFYSSNSNDNGNEQPDNGVSPDEPQVSNETTAANE